MSCFVDWEGFAARAHCAPRLMGCCSTYTAMRASRHPGIYIRSTRIMLVCSSRTHYSCSYDLFRPMFPLQDPDLIEAWAGRLRSVPREEHISGRHFVLHLPLKCSHGSFQGVYDVQVANVGTPLLGCTSDRLKQFICRKVIVIKSPEALHVTARRAWYACCTPKKHCGF